MKYTDLHIHALFGVDDGAKTEAEMFAMVDASYKDGVRMLCVTPHYHPGYFGDNHTKIDSAFYVLTEYVHQHYPEMKLCLGNELRYSNDCVSWLNNGQCHTLNETQYVLVDFSEMVEAQTILNGLKCLLNAGYCPVLAHVERYRSLWGKTGLIRSFLENGALLQMDTQSILGEFGFHVKRQCGILLKERLIELICSDSHDIRYRPPEMSRCFQAVQKKYGSDYAKALFCNNGKKILNEEATQEEFD